MDTTLAALKKGERAIIKDVSAEEIPLKLLEMGCLPGNEVELLELAPFKDPMYFNVNGSYLAIRQDTAQLVTIEKITNGKTN